MLGYFSNNKNKKITDEQQYSEDIPRKRKKDLPSLFSQALIKHKLTSASPP